MSDWTYHAQDARTGAWISRDLPLTNVEINDVLTGHGSMRASIVPEVPGMGPLEEWGTFIYAEKYDGIRFAGILAGSTVSEDGQSLDLDIRSFTAYAQGQPYTEKFRLWDADPLDCVREIWRFLQSFDRGDLGLVVDGDSSPVSISDVQPPAKPARADVTYPTGSSYGTAGAHWPRPARPVRLRKKRPKKRKRRKGESDAHWNTYVSNYNARLQAWKDARDAKYGNRKSEWNAWHDRLDAMQSKWEDDYGDREPYKLLWWEQPDCGEELDRLAQEGGFEWRERHTWANVGKTAVNHRLQLGYPTIGVTHTEVLVPGGDLATTPGITRAGDRFANVVFAIGAGEGRKTLRVSANGDDGRLRRAISVARKNIKRKRRLEAVARDERSYRTLLRDVPEIAVWDVDGNLGTLRLGDTVPVQVNEGWPAGTTTHRIVGRRYQPDDDDVIFLQLVRAERSSS